MGERWDERTDVAVISWQSKSGRHGGSGVALRCSESYNETHWRTQTFGPIEDEIVTSFRPLALIDPDARAVVEHLRDLMLAALEAHGVDDPTRVDYANALVDALREFAEPTTVYTHYPEKVGDDGIVVSLCGKVWRPNAHAVSEGRCPECVAAVESGWVK